MNFAFGFTEVFHYVFNLFVTHVGEISSLQVAVLVSVSLVFGLGLSNGGPATVIWGFAVNWFFVMIIAHSMAELCSAYPSAGVFLHRIDFLTSFKWPHSFKRECLPLGWASCDPRMDTLGFLRLWMVKLHGKCCW
jgi:hypothetical protein